MIYFSIIFLLQGLPYQNSASYPWGLGGYNWAGSAAFPTVAAAAAAPAATIAPFPAGSEVSGELTIKLLLYDKDIHTALNLRTESEYDLTVKHTPIHFVLNQKLMCRRNMLHVVFMF